MRAQTPSYVVSTKIHLPESIANLLEKSFRISNSAYNEALSFGLKRFEALKRNPYYRELLEARRLALKGIAWLEKAKKTAKGLKQQVKCYNKMLSELRKAYSLTESELQKYLAGQRRNVGSPYQQLAACEIQIIAPQAYQTLEKVLSIKLNRTKYGLEVNMTYKLVIETVRTKTRHV